MAERQVRGGPAAVGERGEFVGRGVERAGDPLAGADEDPADLGVADGAAGEAVLLDRDVVQESTPVRLRPRAARKSVLEERDSG
ncbi:hypothetical protein, partial [Streptomyces sp. ISL-86]|uniref:hypothetical protein n=1 Tax=Streptomyces sp. ISL-86 TaxID=2819187 RepID=UPI001BEC5A52